MIFMRTVQDCYGNKVRDDGENAMKLAWTRGAIGSYLWVCCFQYFVAEQIARLAWKIPYSMSANFISDLGAVHCTATAVDAADAVCSPLHALMNGSFELQGLLIAMGSLLVAKLFPAGWLFRFALFLLAVSGIGVLLVGVAPEDVNPSLHYAAAAEHFLCDNIGMALLGMALLVQARSKGWGAYTLVSGTVGFAATLLLSRRMFLGLGVGGMERVASYPFPLWLAAMGMTALRGTAPR